MRLKDDQIHRLAEKIFGDLTASGLITPKQERGTVLAAVKGAIAADIRGEEDLEREAERILEQTLRSMGGSAAGIDRHRMLRMVKEKLARERKIVL